MEKEAKSLKKFNNQNFEILSFRHQSTSGENLPSDWESHHIDVETIYCYKDYNLGDERNIFSIVLTKMESSIVIKFLKCKVLKTETLMSDIKQQVLRVCAYHGIALCCVTFPTDNELTTILEALRGGHKSSLSLNLKPLIVPRDFYGNVMNRVNLGLDKEDEMENFEDAQCQQDEPDFYIIEDDAIEYQNVRSYTQREEQKVKKISFRKFDHVAFRYIVAPYAMIKTLGVNAHVAVMNKAVIYSCETKTATIKVRHGCPFAVQKEYRKLSKSFYDHYRLFLHYQRNNFSDIVIVKDKIYMIRDQLMTIRDNILNTSVEFLTGTQEGNKIIFELADGQILTTTTDDTFTRHKFVIEKRGTNYAICVKKYSDAPELFEEYDFRESS